MSDLRTLLTGFSLIQRGAGQEYREHDMFVKCEQ